LTVMFARRAFLAFFLGCLVGSAAPAVADAADDPGAVISTLGDKALAEIKKNSSARPQMEANFKVLLETYFDVPSISRFVLARYWRVATEAERTEFTTLFEQLVVQSYAARFSEYSGETFKINNVVKDQPDPGDAIVHTQIQAAGQEPVRADWRLKDNGGHYRIVDVKIEGVSMVQTFRDEFASVIRTNGGTVAGLNEALRKKIAQASAS
jgi:phospholipid transport system substrate-binding protein